MAAETHPYAQRETVCLEDLGDCIVTQPARPIPAYWEEALVPFHTPSGRRVQRGPTVATWQEVLAGVAAGDAVLPIQAEASRYYPWPGIVYIPILDAPPCQWALIWRTAGETALIRAFARAGRDSVPVAPAAIHAEASRTIPDTPLLRRNATNSDDVCRLKPMTTDLLSLPSLEGAQVVVPAPDAGPGNWAGAASAVVVDGVYLTYRVRRPLAEGRGVAVVVARSPDGVHFETVSEVWRDEFGAESFERPVVVLTPDGGWRLYLSCATPGSKHWWIEAVDADRPRAWPGGRTVRPGDATARGQGPGHRGRRQRWTCGSASTR